MIFKPGSPEVYIVTRVSGADGVPYTHKVLTYVQKLPMVATGPVEAVEDRGFRRTTSNRKRYELLVSRGPFLDPFG
jgi:CRISPR/Cas system-associated protein Csm6